ncbi:MAG: glycosyltransferase family 39 protein [Acidocella sp.]|nr:glycosyltransferase family 39 protein [Acidocella sp.]
MNIVRRGAWPLSIFLLALLPRLIDLGTRPFWLDEVFTLNRASLAPAALVQDSFQNHHMPSFFLLLSPLVQLGHPEFWLRFPSAVFGALSVVLVFVIASRIGGRLAGVLAALIIGLSPTALAFSQEARSYTLEMTLILVGLYGLIQLAQDLPGAAGPMMRGQARAGWLAFILGTTGAVDVLGDGLPWLLTANIIFLCLLPFTPDRKRFAGNFLCADIIVAVLCAPLYVLMSHYQSSSPLDAMMWIPPLNISRLWYNLGSVYLMRLADSVTFHFMKEATPGLIVWLIDAVLLAAVATAAWRLRRRPVILALLGISLVFLPALFIITSLWRPILLPRYILWSAAPFAILAGIGAAALLDACTPRLRVAAVAAATALLLFNVAPYYHAETKPRWDIAARMLAQEVEPGDVVYLYDLGALSILRVYLPPGTQTVVLNDSKGDLTHAQVAMSQGKRVWAVYGHAGQSGGTGEMQKFYAKAQVLGTPKIMQTAGSRIFIALFDPATAHLAQNCTVQPLGHSPSGCS